MNVIKTAILTSFILLAFAACEVEDIDIDTRIQMFEDDLNSSDRNGIWENFSSSATSVYSSMQNTAYWDGAGTWQQSYQPFEINVSVAGSTATGTLVRNGAGDAAIILDMVSEKDGSATKWYIDNISVGGTYVIQDYTY